MKIRIGCDEWNVYSAYPDTSESEPQVEVDEAIVSKWNRVFEEFEAVQREIRDEYEKAVK